MSPRLRFAPVVHRHDTRREEESEVAFLHAAAAWFNAYGVIAHRVMTDNGSAYRSRSFAAAIAVHGAERKRTRPCTPQTDGSAERLTKPSIRKRAYVSHFQY